MKKKNDTCNIRRLVNETIVPSTPQPFNPVYCIEDCQILGLKDQSDIPILNGLYCKACSSNHQQIFHTTPFVSYIKNKSNDILHHCQGVRQCQWHKDFTKASVIMAREQFRNQGRKYPILMAMHTISFVKLEIGCGFMKIGLFIAIPSSKLPSHAKLMQPFNYYLRINIYQLNLHCASHSKF